MEGFETFDVGPWSDLIWEGLWITVYATVLGTLLAVVIAFALGLLSLSKHVVPRAFARVVVETFRGTSLVVQLFWIVFALPVVTGYRIGEPEMNAVIALGLNFGAYGAEVVRGSIKAVPRPQREACTALNLTAVHRFRRVILPQALPLMIPPAGNLVVQLIKSTPLVYLVGVVDLFTVGDEMRKAETGSIGLIYLGLGVVFFLLSMMVVALAQLLENRAKRRLGQKPVSIVTTALGDASTADVSGAGGGGR
ncbi:MAG: amino acid ABC transporter permease [Actinomycetota bacterium]|nr:amino acid ABC transporter permease [Actinomycetota bacterium]